MGYQQSAQATEQQVESQSAEQASQTDYGSNQEQCALVDGCDASVPTLDEIFWDGFPDEHGGLIGDLASVTGRSMELQAQVPPDMSENLEYHIQGAFDLDDALALSIESIQGEAYFEGEEVKFSQEAYEEVMELWDRLEISLDILREHNGILARVLAMDLAGQLATLSELAAALVEAGVERSMAQAGADLDAKAKALQESWKPVVGSIAKLPADVAVDAAVGQAILIGVPAVLGFVGVSGTLPAVVVAAAIAFGGSMIWDAISGSWGADVGELGEKINDVNGHIDLGADATAIKNVGEGFAKSADDVGKMSTAVTVVMDLVSIGHAIEGAYTAKSDFDAFVASYGELEKLWGEATTLLGGLINFADGMRAAVAGLSDEINEADVKIRELEGVFGEGLYP